MKKNRTVWIVDDDKSIRWVLEKAAQNEKFNTRSFENADDLLYALESDCPDVVVSDIRMPGMEGIELLAELNERIPDMPVIIMTAYADLEKAVESFSAGAFEYLPKPFDVAEMVAVINRALRKSKDIPGYLTEKKTQPDLIIGSSSPMQEVFRAIGRLSNAEMTVLITGESGTGKELVARALHRHSPRRKAPLVAINAAAIPKDLLESELFGHEKGAFTGADSKRLGRFEQAHGGTLFLDEIGDMPADLQARLLRVLANGEFYRVGGGNPIKADVRLIAATNHNLESRVEQGLFREDLLHRLNVIRLELPSLRDRKSDIGNLVDYFLKIIATDLGVPPKVVSESALQSLESFAWPGNVRQLENVCRQLMVMVPSQKIELDDLPVEINIKSAIQKNESEWDWEVSLEKWVRSRLQDGSVRILNEAAPRFEAVLIKVALSVAGGKRKGAAKLLGWGRNTLTRKINELGINKLV